MSSLQTSDYPIDGVAILHGETPDLLLLAVRLPPDTNYLTSPIIRQIEGEAAEPVRIEDRHIDRKLPGCQNEKDGCAHVDFAYVEVVGGPAAARQRINAAIAAFVNESSAKNFIDMYVSGREQHPVGIPSPWTLTQRVKVLRSAAPVFSLEFDEYSYTGLGHGASHRSYHNFDPVTGEPIKLSSILKDGSMARLTAIAEVHFRKDRKLAATVNLEDEGFHFPAGRFALNDNYGFGEKALVFYFNDYEIADYAHGATLLEIPYAELRDLLRPEAGESNGFLLGRVGSPAVRGPITSMPRPPAPAPSAGPRPGGVKVNPKDGLRYVWIPPGTFMMGCSPGDSYCQNWEKPAHQVTITKGFWLGQTKVTQAAYQRVAGNNPSYFKGPKLPVEMVSWNDARNYCQAAGMRLPAEAEWEYAARGGSTAARYGNLNDIAWYFDNSGENTHEVGLKQANAFGLYDMLGNVLEWVADWFAEYPAGSQSDPVGPVSGRYRLARGACWNFNPTLVRVSFRGRNEPGYRDNMVGLRCAGN